MWISLEAGGNRTDFTGRLEVDRDRSGGEESGKGRDGCGERVWVEINGIEGINMSKNLVLWKPAGLYDGDPNEDSQQWVWDWVALN